MQLEEMQTCTEAAKIIGCTPGLVRKYIASGLISGAVKVTSRLWMIPAKEAERLRESLAPTGRPRNSQKTS